MATKKKGALMTPQQYAASEFNTDKIQQLAICKRLREGRSLPNVVDVAHYGRFYVLTVRG